MPTVPGTERGEVEAAPRLDIVVVNWNAGVLLEQCLASVTRSALSAVRLGAVVIVDNASTDGSIERAERSLASSFRIVRSSQNLGFGKACNLGARYGTGEWLLFLNPDTCLQPDSVEIAVRAASRHAAENVAVCGIRLVDESGGTARSCARFPDWAMFASASVGLDKLVPQRFRSHIMSEWDHGSTRLVDHVIGAFYLVKREAFEAVGGFDERFFVYLEDLDLSKRLHERGYRTLYCADGYAFHAGGGTSRAIPARRVYLALRSRLQYAWKHFPAAGAAVVTVCTLAAEPIARTVRAVATLRLPEVWYVCIAYSHLWGSILRSGVSRRDAR